MVEAANDTLRSRSASALQKAETTRALQPPRQRRLFVHVVRPNPVICVPQKITCKASVSTTDEAARLASQALTDFAPRDRPGTAPDDGRPKPFPLDPAHRKRRQTQTRGKASTGNHAVTKRRVSVGEVPLQSSRSNCQGRQGSRRVGQPGRWGLYVRSSSPLRCGTVVELA